MTLTRSGKNQLPKSDKKHNEVNTLGQCSDFFGNFVQNLLK